MTVIGSVTGTFRFYLKNPQIAVIGVSKWAAGTFFAGIVASFVLPAGIMEDILEMGPGPLILNLPAVLAAAALLTLSALLVESYFTAASYRFIKTRSLGRAYVEALSFAPRMLGVTVVKALVIALLAAAAAAAAYATLKAFSFAFNTPLGEQSLGEEMVRQAISGAMVGFVTMGVLAAACLAFTLATVWISVKLMFMGLLVSSGGLGVMDSFKASRLHTNGYFRKTLYSVLLFGLVVSLIVLPTYSYTLAFGGPGGYVQGILASLVSPLAEIFAMTLYFDVKKRRETDDSRFTVAYRSAVPVNKL